jgi:hypothetical protein
MKTITVEFYTWARCFTEVEVPDDYQLMGEDPYQIWENICENNPECIPYDIVDDSYYDVPAMDGFDLGQMGLDYIESITLEDDQGEEVMSKSFDKVKWNH